MPSIEKKESGLKKSLGLIFVYTVATGSIFTYVSYWDSVFFSYCGAGTFLAFALMTLAILPVALVYSELSPRRTDLQHRGHEQAHGLPGLLADHGCLDLRSPGCVHGHRYLL